MQETWVQSLVQECSMCHGTTKPMYHNYWARALEPRSHNCQSPWALQPVLHQQEKPPQWVACPLQLDSSPHSSQLAKVWAATMRWIQCNGKLHRRDERVRRKQQGWTCVAVSWVGNSWRSIGYDSVLSLSRPWVWSLVGELGSHKSAAINKPKQNKQKKKTSHES